MKWWLYAARLRTLPLSLSGIILGACIADARGSFDWVIFLLACATTISFQVLSNFANDYGDGIKGTDDNRKGEKRAVASGMISARRMQYAMVVCAFISLFLSIILIYISFNENIGLVFVFLILALVSIIAAIKYTVGKNAYGYMGLGDLFVFLFFGILAVCGTYTLFIHSFWLPLLLPASSIGMLSMAVLNLNNMRDLSSDMLYGKKTLVVQIGFNAAKKYHVVLVILPYILSSLFILLFFTYEWYSFLFVLTLIPILTHLKRVNSVVDTAALDAELKVVAMATFFFALLMGLGLVFA